MQKCANYYMYENPRNKLKRILKHQQFQHVFHPRILPLLIKNYEI